MERGLLFYSGKGIQDIKRTAGTGAAGTEDTYTIFYTDKSVSAFGVRHGANGAPGPVPDLTLYSTKAQADLLYKPIGYEPDLSNYYTKSQNDAIYLGINSQAYDSARFGGQLPSYYQVAGSYLTSITKEQVEAVLTGSITSHSHNYQAPITTGSTSQYLRGDLSLATFPTIPTNTNQLTNGAGFITGINSSMMTSAFGSQTANMVYASPNGSAGTPTFRYLTSNDIPSGVNAYIWNQYAQQNAVINVSGNITTGGQFNGSGAGITGLTNSQITTALGYTPLPTRTFGSAANNNTGDFILNQNSSPQSANMWINGKIGNNILDNASFISNWGGPNWFGIGGTTSTQHLIRLGMTDVEGVFQSAPGDMLFQVDGAATFASTVNATGYLLNGNNLFSSLSTNYIPKWNGSTMINSLISDDGTRVLINSTESRLTGGANTGRFIVENDNVTAYSICYGSSHSTEPSTYEISGAKITLNTGDYLRAIITNNGNVLIGTTTDNGYKLAVNGTGYFNGNITASGFKTSRNSASYLLATDGSDIAVGTLGGVNQTQTSYSASGGGSIICGQPFATGAYKKVLIYMLAMYGTAAYNFPTPFNYTPIYTTNNSSVSINVQYNSITITSTYASSGWIILEGY